VYTRENERIRTQTTNNKRGTEPSPSLVHAPGEGGGGEEPEEGADDGEGDVGDVFPEVDAMFIGEKLWHDERLEKMGYEMFYKRTEGEKFGRFLVVVRDKREWR
jgi:hypothetical protein